MILSGELRTVNPKQHFDDFFYIESQLISLRFVEEAKIFEMIVRQLWESEEDLWREITDKPNGQTPSKFDYLRFEKVENFRCKSHRIRKDNGQIDYNLLNSASFLIQDLALAKTASNWHIRLHFAVKTECDFHFQNLKVKRRLGIGKKRENSEDFDYFDALTNKAFDFYNPFDLT